MKKYSILLLVIFIAACSSEVSTEEANSQVQEYKTEISELNSKIEELEKITKSEKNTDSTKKELNISVMECKNSEFEHFFTTTATLEAVKSAYISPEMNGQVTKIYVEEGTTVSKGQLLLSLNANTLQSSLVELETGLNLADLVYKKQAQLWKQKIGSEIQYLEAKNAKEALENKIKSLKAQIELTKVTAPISGIIDAVDIKVGEMATPGRPIVSLVNLSKMYVNAYVSESYLSTLSKGDEALVTFPTYPDIKIDAKIHRVGNIIDAGNRTVKVQVIINNINNKLKPNMIAQIKMRDYDSKESIVVPSIIIRNDLEGFYVYVAKENGGNYFAQKKYVQTGKSNNESTIITSGLTVGEKVITEGYNLVKNGTQVNF